MKTDQVAEFELAAVTVTVVPEMVQAAAIGVAPCTCARQWASAGVEGCAFKVTVQLVLELIVQALPFARRCCVFVQSCSTSRCANGCKLPPDQFLRVATLPVREMPGAPEVICVSVDVNATVP